MGKLQLLFLWKATLREKEDLSFSRKDGASLKRRIRIFSALQRRREFFSRPTPLWNVVSLQERLFLEER